jgi:3-phosphoshikimate 1-carboxyvinyltransferase
MSWFRITPAGRPLDGQARVPGDKSIGHRSLLFGGLAAGTVRVTGLSGGADNARSAAAMQALGARIERRGDEVVIHGAGLDGLRAPAAPIDCGNSGTSMRLLAGILAGQTFASRMFGDESLSRRPMRRVIDPLALMGAEITGAAGPKAGEVYPPLDFHARVRPRSLTAIEYRLPVASAQVKSAVLLAGLWADGLTRVIEPGATRDHTERMLAHMGAPLTVHGGGVVELDTRGWDRILGADEFRVPADPSSAAFAVAAALVAGAGRVVVPAVCTNSTRIGFLDALDAMGAVIERRAPRHEGGEGVADLVIAGAGHALRATVVDGDLTVRSIDEIPVLAVVAARARGVTRFRDAAELRVKESDRVATTAAMLRAFGVTVDEHPDGLDVHGAPERPLAAARIDAAGDHRIAMAAVVGALVADGPCTVDDVDNVATSFPTFVEVMRGLGAEVEPG